VVKEAKNQTKIIPGGHGVTEYIRNGLYAQLLAPYYHYFEKSQLLILNYDDLNTNPQALMEKISAFLGVKYHPVNFQKKYNVESEHVSEDIDIKDAEIDELKHLYKDELLVLQNMVDFNLNDWRS